MYLQVHVIANTRLVRFVLVRLSPNWPNTNETAVNGRCQQEMWLHTPRFLFHRQRVQTRSSRACLLGRRTVNRVQTGRRVATQQVESVYGTFELCQYIINRTRQFTGRDASNVDRITDYNGFSPRRSREVASVYLTSLFLVTLFNCIIFIVLFTSLMWHISQYNWVFNERKCATCNVGSPFTVSSWLMSCISFTVSASLF